MTCTLKDLPERVSARLIDFTGPAGRVHHLMSMGLSSHIPLRIVRKLFFGNTYVIDAGGEQMVLRKQDAECLRVST